ncbi:MAG: class I SAM-dependent methyltransferase [Bacteroidales bacterium]|nr:class I SAM-dependent methyltransferase [Bacteroidales bacterium]
MEAFTVNPFDPIAKEYDQWFDDNKTAYLSELEALKFFMPVQGKGIEIGVGTGRFASQLGIKCGVEPSERMASLARQRGIEVVTAFGEQMPFPDCSFDFAIMVTVDCFVSDIRQVYREAFRVIRNGGVLIIGAMCASHPPNTTRIFRKC